MTVLQSDGCGSINGDIYQRGCASGDILFVVSTYFCIGEVDRFSVQIGSYQSHLCSGDLCRTFSFIRAFVHCILLGEVYIGYIGTVKHGDMCIGCSRSTHNTSFTDLYSSYNALHDIKFDICSGSVSRRRSKLLQRIMTILQLNCCRITNRNILKIVCCFGDIGIYISGYFHIRKVDLMIVKICTGKLHLRTGDLCRSLGFFRIFVY